MMKKGFLNSAAAAETRPLLGRRPPVPRAPGSQMTIDQFSLERFLGQGNFCEVFEALPFDKSLFDGKPVALKIFDRHRVAKMQKARDVIMERHCMLRLNDPGHPNIIRLLGTFKDEDRVCLLYELADNGELWDCVRYGGVPSEALATRYIFSLASAIEYMHGKGIIHRDIKAENVVVMHDGNIKLIDFGTAVDQEHPEVQPAVLGAVPPLSLPSDNNKRERRAAARPSFAHHVGTPQFMSPEAVQNKDSGRMRDLWSLGCTIYQIITGYPPFDASTNYFVFLRVQARDLQFPPDFPADAKNLVEQLLAPDPQSRLGATAGMKEVWLHPFFTTRLHRMQQQMLQSEKLLALQQDPPKTEEQHQQQQPQEEKQQRQSDQQQQPPSKRLQQQEEKEQEAGVGSREVGDVQGEYKQQRQQQIPSEEQLKKLLQQSEEYVTRTPAPVASLQGLCMQSILRKVGELLDKEETKQFEKEAEELRQAAALAAEEPNEEDEEHEESEKRGQGKKGDEKGEKGRSGGVGGEAEKKETKEKQRVGGEATAGEKNKTTAAATAGEGGSASAAGCATGALLRAAAAAASVHVGFSEDAAMEEGSDRSTAAAAGERRGNEEEVCLSAGKGSAEDQQAGVLAAQSARGQYRGEGETQEEEQQQQEGEQELEMEEKTMEKRQGNTRNDEEQQNERGEEAEEVKGKERRSWGEKSAREEKDSAGVNWKELLKAVVGKEMWERREDASSSGRMQLLLKRVKFMVSSRKKLLQWQQKLADQWLAESNKGRMEEEDSEEE